MDLLRRISLALLVTAIILLGLLMGGLRLAMANLDSFKSEISYLISRDAIPGVSFSTMRADWNYFNPILAVQNASITLPNHSQSLFIDELTVEFDFWASLREQAPMVLEISGKIEKLELTRDAEGRWWMDEISIDSAADTDIPGLAQMLGFLPSYLKIDLNRLILNDQASKSIYQFERLQARIKHQKEHFFIQLSSALPDSLGQGLVFKGVVNLDRSVLYLKSTKLNLRRFGDLFGVDTAAIREAQINGEIWVNLARDRVLAVIGKLSVEEGLLQLEDSREPLEFDLRTQFTALNEGKQWRLSSDTRLLQINQKNFAGFRSQLEFADPTDLSQVSAWVERFDLSSLATVAEAFFPQQVYENILLGQPQGSLEDIFVSYDQAHPQKSRLSALAVNVSSKVTGDLPGIVNLNGRIIAEGNNIGLDLNGSKMQLDFGRQFRGPLEIDSFKLNASASYVDSRLLLSVNQFEGYNDDIRLSGRLWLEGDGQHSPFMYLRAHYSEGRGSTTHKYLPINLLPAKTLAWLDRGIKDVYVESGELLYHGRLQSIAGLDRDKSGEFYTAFGVRDAEVFFAPGWLPATRGSGRVLFHNKRMEINLDSVSYDRLDNINANVTIDDLTNAVLNIDIRTAMPVERAFQTWVDTPVGERYRGIVSQLDRMQGQVSSAINIRLPLTSGSNKALVAVKVDFQEAAIAASNWGVSLSAINGALKVDGKGVSASNIKARYFDDPVNIDISPDRNSGDSIVLARGKLKSGSVLNRLPPLIKGAFKGRSDWQVRIAIAADSKSGDDPYLKIQAASNLKNTAIELPLPFEKSAAETSRLSAAVDFFQDRIEFRSDLASTISSSGRLLADSSAGFRLDRLDLAFATALLPTSGQGLRIYGNIPYLSLADWKQQLGSSAYEQPDLLQSVDLSIDQLLAFDRDLGLFEISLQRSKEGFSGNFASAMIKGAFDLPAEPSPLKPLQLDLDYLVIPRSDEPADYSSLLPADLIDVNLDSKLFEFHGMDFQDLSLEARVQENTLYLDSVAMRHDAVFLQASARWDYAPSSGKHHSSLQVVVQGERFGQAMSELGFGDSISDAEIDFSGQFAWAAGLPDFRWDSLAGDARLKLSEGVLNNVDPGSGRLVGLLSLNALPRRLSLDFKDMLIGGMEFDSITGTYRLDGGDLYTEDTRMEGPAASIHISGKTELKEQTYDQKILVVPKIRQTLPVIGAISGGSAVGWGLLLLQNLFKKVIDKVVEIEYRVSGSWDDPVIELIQAVDVNNATVEDYEK